MKDMEILWDRAVKAEEKVSRLKMHVQNPVKYSDYDIHSADHEVQGVLIYLQLWRDELLQYMKENKKDDTDE